MAIYSHTLAESNKSLLRPRHLPRPDSCINNDGVKPPSCFKAADHTIRQSKSQHHLQVSKLDSRKVTFEVSRQCHITRWSCNASKVYWWFNHRHNMCCCTLSNKGPLAVAGKVQNTVCALYSVGQRGPTNACIKFTHLLFWGEQFWTRLAGFEEDNGEII
jgi:hypothetical protein